MARVVDEGTSTVAISGITCGGCKEIVRQAILGVEGVVSCSVDVLAGEATIRGSVSREALSAALEATGRVILPPGCSLTTLRVGGMTCGHCSARVEEALRAVEGVASATVNLEAGLATVVGSAAAAELVAAVEGAGKSAAVAEAEDGPPTLLLAGALAVADSLKPDARPVVKQLQQRGIEVGSSPRSIPTTCACVARPRACAVRPARRGPRADGDLRE